MAGRPIAFDVTHLVSRLDSQATSGIDRVDLAYGRHFAAEGRLHCGLHFGWRRPHPFTPARVADVVARLDTRVGDADGAPSPAWPALRAWLLGETAGATAPAVRTDGSLRGWAARACLRVAADGPFRLPRGALYLNVAQHAFELHRFFRWLDARPDVLPVFLVHDLLPLDHPEFFRTGYGPRFERRMQTILRRARALVVTSEAVRARVSAEYARRGAAPVPIHVQPLASPLGPAAAGDRDEGLLGRPYFVVVSTIEPRKNHAMLLHAWRDLAAAMPSPPKLVVVGAPGWDCDSTLALLDRSPALSRCVIRVSGLPRASLRALVANARALLMPSFAEGYGIPLVEALTLGTPAVASDIPVFHEVTQGLADFLSPLDGTAWRDRVMALASAPRRAATGFAAPAAADYFAGVETFLSGL